MTRTPNKPRVLCVTHRVPFPPDRGDRIRTWNVLKFLTQRAEVDLISLTDEAVCDETRQRLERITGRLAIVARGSLQRYSAGVWSALQGHSLTEGFFGDGECRRLIRDWNSTRPYAAVYASSSGIAPLVLSPDAALSARVWIDLMDVDSQKWLDYSKSSGLPMSAIYRLEGQRLRILEKLIAQQADRLLVVTDAERQLFHSFCESAPVQAVGNGVDLDYFIPAETRATPMSCAFVGVMDYRPNIDAVCWFAENVWPQVRRRYPESVFSIVGKSPTPEVRALSGCDGIHVTGPVPDVRPWLAKAACIVVPLRIARGVQNKVLEAMACGRPIVCSPTPLQGLDVEHGQQLLAAETPSEWMHQLSTVFDNPTRAAELGKAARDWVARNHRWESCLEPLTELTTRHAKSVTLKAEVSF